MPGKRQVLSYGSGKSKGRIVELGWEWEHVKRETPASPTDQSLQDTTAETFGNVDR